MAKMIAVMTKARKIRGVSYPAQPTEYEVCINDAGKLTIFRKGVEAASFVVGDEAEYDSYNLKYTGTITGFTEKCVTIVAYKGHPGMEKTHRLDLNTFCWRNWDFDAVATANYNHNEMMYI